MSDDTGNTETNGQSSLQEVVDPVYTAAQAQALTQYNLIMSNADVFISNCRNQLGSVLESYLTGLRISIDQMQKELVFYHTIDNLVAHQELNPERLQKIFSELAQFRSELMAEANRMKAEMQKRKEAVPTTNDNIH